MTVVAWDGKTLAADKRVSYGTAHRNTTKIMRIGDTLAGIAGHAIYCMAVVNWLNEGGDPKNFPLLPEAAEDMVSVLVITEEGLILEYGHLPTPLIYDNHKFFSIGCGAPYAMSAMHFGRTAKEAVEFASQMDIGCGNGVDTLEFDQYLAPCIIQPGDPEWDEDVK